jgi:hypothetical protein
MALPEDDQASDDQASPLRLRVTRQRATLYNMLIDPMRRTARRCVKAWDERPALDRILLESIPKVPYVTYLYALDNTGRQMSANASPDGLLQEDFGRDRSGRPYMQGLAPEGDMTLSEAYISQRVGRPSVTAIQRVHRDGQQVGYVGADFDLRRLPITKELYSEPGRWRQIKGDPAIRGHVFQQCRVQSRMDDAIDIVLPVLEELVREHGVFHVKIHFSSSRATVWMMEDPYRYQLLEFDDLVDPDVCLAFPHHAYPADAVVPAEQIRPVLDTFRHLRYADDTIYLRAGSINVFNGIVGLNFSCDGSHYIPFGQFLARDSEFWDGID